MFKDFSFICSHFKLILYTVLNKKPHQDSPRKSNSWLALKPTKAAFTRERTMLMTETAPFTITPTKCSTVRCARVTSTKSVSINHWTFSPSVWLKTTLTLTLSVTFTKKTLSSVKSVSHLQGQSSESLTGRVTFTDAFPAQPLTTLTTASAWLTTLLTPVLIAMLLKDTWKSWSWLRTIFTADAWFQF